jgi:biotin carboxyl carrier protein
MLNHPFIKWGAAIAVIITIIIVSSRKSTSDSTAITTSVQKGDFTSIVYSTGQLQAENSESINLPSEMSSRRLGIYEIKITQIVEEGTVVDSGGYVATLDYSAVEELRIKAYEEWEKALNAYEDAKIDTNMNLSNLRDDLLNGKVQLEEKKLILDQSLYESPAVKRQAQLDVERAEREMEQKERNYELKQKQDEYKVYRAWEKVKTEKETLNDLDKLMGALEVKAPKPGMVIYSFDRFGKKIKAGASISRWRPQIAELPDLSSMISKTFINEIDISKVKTGQKVKVGIDAFPEKHFDGQIISVANIGQAIPGGDAKVFEVTVKLDGSDPDLRPAMTTSNVITTDIIENTLFIPLESVFSNDSLRFVYVKERNNIRKQIVDLGSENENFVQVLAGLTEGEELFMNEPKDKEDLLLEGKAIYDTIQVRKQREIETLKKATSAASADPSQKPDGKKKKRVIRGSQTEVIK